MTAQPPVAQEHATAGDHDVEASPGRTLRFTVNGQVRTVAIEDRHLLAEVLRVQLELTGTHVGCANGDCGACTIRIGDRITKSCLVLAASVEGAHITTIEGRKPDGNLDDIADTLWRHDAVQCGFCAPGHVFVIEDLLEQDESPTEDAVRKSLEGNLCRCTGYVNLVNAACALSGLRGKVKQDLT